MSKSILTLLIASIISFLLCLIISPIVCKGVDSDEIMGTYEVDAFPPTIVGLLLSGTSAVFASLYIKKLSAKYGVAANSLIMSIGIGLFGLFYGLKTAYSDAASVLSSFIYNWASYGESRGMSKWVRSFEETSGKYTFLIVASLILIAAGIYKIYFDFRKKSHS